MLSMTSITTDIGDLMHLLRATWANKIKWIWCQTESLKTPEKRTGILYLPSCVPRGELSVASSVKSWEGSHEAAHVPC